MQSTYTKRRSHWLVSAVITLLLSVGGISTFADERGKSLELNENTKHHSSATVKAAVAKHQTKSAEERKGAKKSKKNRQHVPYEQRDADHDGIANGADRCPYQLHCSQRTSRVRAN